MYIHMLKMNSLTTTREVVCWYITVLLLNYTVNGFIHCTCMLQQFNFSTCSMASNSSTSCCWWSWVHNHFARSAVVIASETTLLLNASQTKWHRARMNYIWTASMYIYIIIHTYICTSTYKGNPPTTSQTRHAQHIPCWQAFVSLLCSHM